jgi:hypothetical protein
MCKSYEQILFNIRTVARFHEGNPLLHIRFSISLDSSSKLKHGQIYIYSSN